MALNFGWKTRDVRESIWVNDPALAGITEAARKQWMEDGDASHLRPFATTGAPTTIRFRNLDPDEHRACLAVMNRGDSDITFQQSILFCFRAGVDFPGLTEIVDANGAKHDVTVSELGFRLLSKEFVASLDPELVTFYGLKVFTASLPTEQEKKAWSRPSTATPSSNGTVPPPAMDEGGV